MQADPVPKSEGRLTPSTSGGPPLPRPGRSRDGVVLGRLRVARWLRTCARPAGSSPRPPRRRGDGGRDGAEAEPGIGGPLSAGRPRSQATPAPSKRGLEGASALRSRICTSRQNELFDRPSGDFDADPINPEG